MPVPSGWQLRQGLITQTGTTMVSEDVAQGGLDVGMVSGSASGVPPGMHPAGTTHWNGSRVTLWQGPRRQLVPSDSHTRMGREARSGPVVIHGVGLAGPRPDRRAHRTE
jgi:hypothetical protein